MTQEDLARILEQFAVVVLKTSQTGLDPDAQYAIILDSIDTVVQAVMFCTDRGRISTPSMN
jgi:hypothetical protein